MLFKGFAAGLLLCLLYSPVRSGHKKGPEGQSPFSMGRTHSSPDLRATLGDPPPPPPKSPRRRSHGVKKAHSSELKQRLREKRRQREAYYDAIHGAARATALDILKRVRSQEILPKPSAVQLPSAITDHLDEWVKFLEMEPGIPLLDYAKSVTLIFDYLRDEHLRDYVRSICPTPKRGRIGAQINRYLQQVDEQIHHFQHLSDVYESNCPDPSNSSTEDSGSDSEADQRTSEPTSARDSTPEQRIARHIHEAAMANARKFFFLHTQGTVSKYDRTSSLRIQQLNDLNIGWRENLEQAVTIAETVDISRDEVIKRFNNQARQVFLNLLPNEAAEYLIRIMDDKKITDKGRQLDWYLQEAYNFMYSTYGSVIEDETKEQTTA